MLYSFGQVRATLCARTGWPNECATCCAQQSCCIEMLWLFGWGLQILSQQCKLMEWYCTEMLRSFCGACKCWANMLWKVAINIVIVWPGLENNLCQWNVSIKAQILTAILSRCINYLFSPCCLFLSSCIRWFICSLVCSSAHLFIYSLHSYSTYTWWTSLASVLSSIRERGSFIIWLTTALGAVKITFSCE